MFGITYDGIGLPVEGERPERGAANAMPARTSTVAAVATAVRVRCLQRTGRFTGALPAARQKNEATGLMSLRNSAVGTLTVPHEGLRVRQALAYTLR